ncbi:hypothetical protein NDA10_002477 [Ustilago hordei]|uniref:Uncharacterized protein n=1 Tax=Ustilago hordei TaxID=120017 RepID=I2FVL4_USTHO|nr:uncharacterized protein UHO2_04495 [Ustilago hordei]KAJ1042450.1 hypothetical protein NDA10_002477 [Ustilago hordei]UTT89875.1 hypothetical protein NDA17_000271 [Ustilago hordei]CCF50957.1 uncharacterized protein UHOR_06861 [Ustilago hordei]SYW84556.1 uncharacterized protein UHO2_04495 [Ustilago hordei]
MMQAANPPPPSQSAAVACSSTRSSSSADAIPHSSRRERETASIHPAIRFVANHHRQHNPHDPKLRAKPSFKSRRSSLFGAMLKSKDDHHHKLGKSSWTTSPPLAPIITRPQASSAISHKHTHSLPMAAPSTSHQSIRTLQTADSGSSNHAEQMKRHGDTRTAISSPCQQIQSSSRTHHPSQTEAERRCLHHGRSSPPNTLSPSPIELVQRSSSTCSSANAKSIHFAAISGQPSPPSMHAAFEPAQTQLQDGAQSPELTSTPFTPDSATTTAQSTPGHLLDASTNSQSPLEMQAQSSAHPPSSSSAREVLPLHLAPPCSRDPSAIPTPIIVPCIVTEASIHSGATHMINQPDDSTTIPLPEAAPTQPSHLPPIKLFHASASQDNLVDSELPRSTSASTYATSAYATSAYATSPQRFSSLGRRSPARLTLLPDLPDPRSLPRTAARDITDELDSPTSPEQVQARAERCMSMLNFLVADSTAASSLQLAQASLSAEHLPRSTPAAQRPPASIPLVQASRQLRLEAAAARAKTLPPSKVDLCEHVNVSVEPILDRLTMFGSMQSSSNYSLAGTVVVQVPKLNLPRLSAAAAALAPHGTTTDRPTVHVEALTVRFIGYSLYVDATGRFNAIKLAELSQELLQPQGFSCPVELLQTSTEERATSPTDDPATKAAQCHINKQSLKYETEFDLSIPGWLPASQRSRFGATFYCLQATAIVEGQAILSAFSAFNALGSDSGSSQPLAMHLAHSLQSELVEPVISKNTLERKSSRSKSKNTWLNKTAKQLQLRTSRKSTGPDADQARSHSSSCRPSASASKETASPLPGESDPLFTKTSEASNQLLPNGKHSIKSACLAILVRRCRDVVPVPVARLARLATASQVLRADGLPPSLSQSIVALARLQEMPDAVTSSLSAVTNRPHISASVSAPVSLASLAAHRQSQVGHAAPTSVAQPCAESGSLSPNASASEALNSTDAAAATSAPPALAPSPRIDAYPTNWGQAERAEPNVIMPPAPSAFDAPRDPAKLAAAASSLTPSATLPNLPSSMSRASSLFDSRFGNANSPPRTSSRSASLGRSSAPLRHFVHRPTLQLPPELGVTPDKDAAGGLNFSLTLSLPSHVHVAGPKSDVLSFGIQIEVGRTEGWDALRKWGGLRLKDMELVCLQTERHSSMPSRSFCATFPLPPPPNRVDAADLPVVTSTRKTPVASDDAQAAAAEMRLRQSYDRSLILSHISLANQGKAPHPVEHNVERIRTTIVGPPPFPLGKPGEEANKQDSDKARKGKTRVNINNSLARGSSGFARSPTRDSPAGSGTHTPDGTSQSAGISSLRAAFAPTAPVNSSSHASVMQPLPRALAPCNNSSSSSLRQAFQGSDGSNRIQRAPRANTAAALSGFSSSPNAPSRSRRPIPFDIGVRETTVTAGLSNTVDASGADAAESDETPTNSSSQAGSQQLRVPARSNSDEDNSLDRWDRPESSSRDRETAAASSSSSSSAATRMGVSSSVTATRSANRPAPRRSRFETAISRLSTFASSMLEQPMEPSTSSTHGSSQDVRAALSAGSSASNGAATASLRATYAFAGDDGQGVDLTKGRVRMTINLPLVPSDVDAARKAGSAQLMPDFESPYVRVRHKLKVKLGFGMKSNVATAQDGEEWAQALVMCVPVRFTEAPPKEVQEQFGPVSLVPDGGRSAATGEAITADQVRGAVASAAAASDATDSQQSSALPATFAEPLLPAYAQLFRDDGSRLADEGEDLPRYPGRMSVVGEIDEDPSSDAAAAAEAVQRAEPACSNLQTSKALGTVDEDQARESNSSWTEAPVYLAASNNEFMHRSRPGSWRYEAATLPRLPTLGRSPRGPTLMDRTTSLAGQRILTQTDSSGVFGLRTPPSHPTSPRQSQSATVSSFAEKESNAEGKARVGSSAFDPLPPRPGMRRRSATTALPVTFSRITPAEVLDEALVTSALEDEEERMDRMQPSHTLESLGARSQRGGVEMMDGSGPDEEDDEEVMVGEMDDDDEEDLNMDAVDSREAESNASHSSMGMRIHRSSTQQTARSEGEEDQEGENVEMSRAM